MILKKTFSVNNVYSVESLKKRTNKIHFHVYIFTDLSEKMIFCSFFKRQRTCTYTNGPMILFHTHKNTVSSEPCGQKLVSGD